MDYIRSTDWKRVTHDHPCPVCSHGSWCCYIGPHEAPFVVCCPRVRSNHETGGGFIHYLRKQSRNRHRFRCRDSARTLRTTDYRWFSQLQAECRLNIVHADINWLASQLRVTPTSLDRLGIGQYQPWSAFSFPMRAGDGRVCGISTREPDTGRKRSIAGSRLGLFVPIELDVDGKTLFVAEGASDCAALLSLRLSAIGRPDCQHGSLKLVEFVRRTVPRRVVIVADRDEVGRHGAASLAGMLRLVRPTTILTPPAKDAREWIMAGATKRDVLELVGDES